MSVGVRQKVIENREENKTYKQVTSAYVLEQIGLIQQRLNDE